MDPQPHDVVRLDKGADLKRNDAVESAAIDLAGHRDALRADVDAGIVHPAGSSVGWFRGRSTASQPLIVSGLEDLLPGPFALQFVV